MRQIDSILARHQINKQEAAFVALMACGRDRDAAAAEAGFKISGAALLRRPNVRGVLQGLAELYFGLLDD